MGSLSTDLRTWSDSPVRELSSIFRSLPWTKTPSAGSRSPEHKQASDGSTSFVSFVVEITPSKRRWINIPLFCLPMRFTTSRRSAEHLWREKSMRKQLQNPKVKGTDCKTLKKFIYKQIQVYLYEIKTLNVLFYFYFLNKTRS